MPSGRSSTVCSSWMSMRPMYLLSRPASLAIAPTMLAGLTPWAWPTSMRNDSMPTSGLSRGGDGARGRSSWLRSACARGGCGRSLCGRSCALGWSCGRSNCGCSMRELSRAGGSNERGGCADVASPRAGRGASLRCGRSWRSAGGLRGVACSVWRPGRVLPSGRSKRGCSKAGLACARSGCSSSGVSPCTMCASAAAMSASGTLCSCS